MGYLVLAGVVFGVNLLPAFGPPTWTLLVFFRLQSSLAVAPLVLIGVLAAASGRLVLAYASRRLRDRLQVLMLAGLVALLRVDWARIFTDRRGFHDGGCQPGASARPASPGVRR